MRNACLLALVAMVCGCTSDVEDFDIEGHEDRQAVDVDVDVETTLDPSGVVLGVTLPPGSIRPPSPVPRPPETLALSPIVKAFVVTPQSSATCLVGRPPVGPVEPLRLRYHIVATERIRTLEFFRNGVSIRRMEWPSSAQLNSVLEASRETYTSPAAAVRYSVVATDTSGRRGTSELTYHVGPHATLSLTGAATMRGAATGAGARVVSVPWIGDNVGTLTLGATFSGGEVYGTIASPHFDPWGRRSGTAEVALTFTREQWDKWLAGGQKLSISARTPAIESGCSTTFHVFPAAALVSSDTPPGSSGGSGTPSGSSGGSTPPDSLWTPSGCQWACNWGDHPDKVIVDFEATVTGCGATPYSTGTQYRVCSLSGAPAGAETSICTGQAVPSGWTLLRRDTSAVHCVPSSSVVGDVQVIRKL